MKLKRIEARKKEREKKTQDLQKLITAADGGSGSAQNPAKRMLEGGGLKKGGTPGVKKKSGSPPSQFLQSKFILLNWRISVE